MVRGKVYCLKSLLAEPSESIRLKAVRDGAGKWRWVPRRDTHRDRLHNDGNV
ncbi:MAG TPA: hypothetical protein V6D29_03685 [Leptolyngbyaceae cyanobacterium]